MWLKRKFFYEDILKVSSSNNSDFFIHYTFLTTFQFKTSCKALKTQYNLGKSYIILQQIIHMLPNYIMFSLYCS